MPPYPSNIGSYTFANSLVTGPAPWQGQGHPKLFINVGKISTQCGLAGTTTLSVAATFTWTPSSPGDTPPPTLDVLESASATAFVGAAPGVTGSADDDLGDAPIVNLGNNGTTSSGSHLVHFALSPGQTVVTLSSHTMTAFFPADVGTGNTALPGTECD